MADMGFLSVESALFPFLGVQQNKLYMMGGAWKVNLSGSLLKTGLNGALLTALLSATGTTSLTESVLTSCLGSLFDISKVTLSKTQETIHAHLVLNDKVVDNVHSPDALYEMLSEEQKQSVNKLEFHELLENLALAGYAKEVKEKEFRLYEKGKFKIIWG